MKLRFSLTLSLCAMMTTVHAVEPLTINVTEGYRAVLESLKPRITQQLGTNVEIVGKQNRELYNEFNKGQPSADVIVFVENKAFGNPQTNQMLSQKSQVLAVSQVVLWCPNMYLQKRVSLADTLTQAQIRTIAVPDKRSVINSIFTRALPNLPPHTQLVATNTGLSAWRMARNRQTQCAVTMDKWLNPNEPFIYVSNEEVTLRGYVHNPKIAFKAQQTLAMLSSPLVQPMMIRISNSDLVSNIKIAH